MKNYRLDMNWRKVTKLSAFLLLTGIIAVGCKKPENSIGKEIYDPEALLDVNGVDTFQLITYCELADSVISGQTPNVLLGSYNDPIFGQVDAGFYAQFRIPTNNPDFGDVSAITVDSVVLSLEYRDFYGEVNAAQTYEVFRLQENLSLDSTYYNFRDHAVAANSIVVAGAETIEPKPGVQTIVGNDTLAPQLRIPLETNFGMEVITAAENGLLTNNESFLEEFKGLYVKTNNPMWSQGGGSVLFLDLRDSDSKITIYYTQDDEPKRYELIANTSCAYYNRVHFENTGSKSKFVLDNPEMGMYEYYAQAGLIRARIEFPTVSNIGKKAVIHRAMLYVPVSYFSGGEFYPSFVAVATTNAPGISGEIALGSNEYNNIFKRYNFLLTSYIQSLVRTDSNFENIGIKIAPAAFGGSTERIVFNGPLTTNKEKPKLVITYTEY